MRVPRCGPETCGMAPEHLSALDATFLELEQADPCELDPRFRLDAHVHRELQALAAVAAAVAP